MSGFQKNSRARQEIKLLPHGWVVLPSKTYPDRVYFYNTLTKCSTWDNLCEVTSDREHNSSSEEKRLFKSIHKPLQKSHFKKQKNKTFIASPDTKSNFKINTEIEDYDEQQDQYFDNVSIDALSSVSTIISPSNSPESIISSKSNMSDSDQPLESNILESNKKELWVHFTSNFDNPMAKKCVALSDFAELSTCGNVKVEANTESLRKKSIVNDFSEGSNVKSLNESSVKNIVNFNKKKKGKIKKKENHSQHFSYKIIKNFSFIRADKTPAQTRLLKLRKQNTERLKEFAAKNPDFVNLNKNNVDINLKSINSNKSFEKETENFSFSGDYFKRIDKSNNVTQQAENHSEVYFSEEMDWEPSSEESDVRNINTFRELYNKTSEVPSEIFFGLNPDQSFLLHMKTCSWFLVLDTNIFVSCLGFVKELRDTKVPDFGYPVIYVPWRVLQELDHLKDSKIDAVERHLHYNVRKAIVFLNENFKSRHPRIFAQSFEDFANMIDVNTSAPDDEILQTCIQFQKLHSDKKLMLLTNDKNLESKAIVSGVKVYSKERFCRMYLTSKAVSPTFSNAVDTSSTDRVIMIDNYICEIQAILKDFLPLFVETEMKMAFEGDWIKLAFKKPPWTLEDALQCLLKHWRSVFFMNFTKETQNEAEKLNEKLFKRVAASTEDIVEVIKTIQRLIYSIRKSQKKKMPYSDLISPTLTKLSGLLKACSPNHSPQTDRVSISLPSSVSTNSDSLFPNEEVSQDEVSNKDISKVKNFFKDIWDSLRSFCWSVSDLINSPDTGNDMIIAGIKQKLSQILKEVEELIVTIEKIFALNVSEISNCHPLIIYFSNFLIRICPAMQPDLINELPRCLAAFFSDFEARFLFTNSLKDFKDFIKDLSQAAEYFNTHFPC